MKCAKRTICVILVLLICFITFAPMEKTEGTVPNYTITEPYRYPVVPGTREWKSLESLQDMIDACHIPEEIVTNMTTEALIETVFNYPLAINIGAYDDPHIGLEEVNKYCNGLQELFKRMDFAEKLRVFTSRSTFVKNANPLERLLSRVLLDKILNRVTTASIAEGTIYYDYTPAGTKVPLLYESTWSDHGITESEGEWWQLHYIDVYDDAIVISKKNPAFNCHSYTFISTNYDTNKYWLQPSYAAYYINDGSYRSVSPAKVGDKVWYGTSHSGIVKSISNGTVTVRSKWGFAGVFEHSITRCPWSSEYGVTYWR